MFSLEVPLEKSLSTSASGCRQNSFPCSRVTKSSYFLLVLGWRWPIGPCHMGFSKFTACFLKPARKGSSSRMLKRNGDHHLCVFLLTSQKFWALSTLKGHTKAWAPGGEVTGVCVLGGGHQGFVYHTPGISSHLSNHSDLVGILSQTI